MSKQYKKRKKNKKLSILANLILVDRDATVITMGKT